MLMFFLTPITESMIDFFNSGNIVSTIMLLLLLTFFLILIYKPSIFTKLINYIKYNKKKKMLESDDYKKLLHGIILRSISKSRILKDEYSFKIQKIKGSILKDQMNYTENSLEIITSDHLSYYNEELIKQLSGLNFCTSNHQCIYGKNMKNIQIHLHKCIIHNLCDIILNHIRQCLKENGLVNMSDDKFRLYIDNTITVILSKAKTQVSEKIKDYIIIFKNDEFELFEKEKLKNVLYDIFYTSRSIAMTAYTQIEKLESELASKLKDVSIEEEINMFVNK